jgi:hypothetical protein
MTVVVKVDDLIGTWELVSTTDLQTGAAIAGVNDASTGIAWEQYTRSHYMVIGMTRGRRVTSLADFAQLSPEEQVKTNYARVWNENNEPIFVAHGGTYTVEGDTIHLIPTLALNTASIGVDFAVKVTRLDQRTLISQGGYPPSNPTTTRELTFRRIE